jgi:hypothetical protein
VLLKPLAYANRSWLSRVKEIWQSARATRAPELEVNEQHFEYWRTRARLRVDGAVHRAARETSPAPATPRRFRSAAPADRCSSVLQVQARAPTLCRATEPSGSPRSWSSPTPAGGSASAPIPRSSARRRHRRHAADDRRRAPPDFHLPSERPSIPDAFVPIHADARVSAGKGDHNDEAIGRLRAGVTPEQARAELDVCRRRSARSPRRKPTSR